MAKYLVETDQGKFEVETEEPSQDHPDFIEPGGEKSFAEKAVSAISPEVQGPPKDGGLMSRLLRGTRQTLFPSNMNEVKSLVNPNAGQYGMSRILEEEGKRVGAAVRASDVSGKIAGSPIGAKLPQAALFPMAMGSAAVDAVSDSLTPSSFQQQLGAEGAGAALRAAGPVLKESAVDPARRALGFQKSQLVSQKSPFETARKIAQANRSARAMLEADAISPTGSLDTTIQNATKELSSGSKKLSSVMDRVDKAGKTIKVASIDSAIIDDLKPKFDDEFTATEKILKDLRAYSKDGLSLKDADELRARWGKIGFQDRTVTSTEANMYREAFKSIDRQVKKHIEAVNPDMISEYVAGKAQQENAINALRGLGNKKAADLGNNIFSLPTKVLAAGQLAAGDVPGALATAGVSEAIRRRGLAPLARGLYGAGRKIEAGTKPGTLAAISAAAKRALEIQRTQKEPTNLGKSFISSVAKRAGQRILSVSGPTEPQAKAFTQIMSSGSPQSMADVESAVKGRFPAIYASGKKAGKDIKRIIQDVFTVQGSPEALDSLVKDIAAKRKNRTIER